MVHRKYTRPLTADQIDKLTKKGRHPEGTVPCLYLKVSPSGAKSWVFMFSRDGRQTEQGLGSWTGAGKAGRISIPLARKKALAIHDQIAFGKNPLIEKRRDEVTFGKCADQLVEVLKGGWKSKNGEQLGANAHRARCTAATEAGCFHCGRGRARSPEAAMARQAGNRVQAQDANREGIRLRDRARTSLGANPAAWKANLDHMLPKPQKLKRGHHPALAYADLPGFWTKLAALDGKPIIKPLQLTILTAARTGEVALVEWSEFDLNGKIWTVPASRSKTRREHRVPLSPEAMELLATVPRIDGEVPRVSGLRQHRDAKGAATGRRSFASDGAWLQVELP